MPYRWKIQSARGKERKTRKRVIACNLSEIRRGGTRGRMILWGKRGGGPREVSESAGSERYVRGLFGVIRTSLNEKSSDEMWDKNNKEMVHFRSL